MNIAYGMDHTSYSHDEMSICYVHFTTSSETYDQLAFLRVQGLCLDNMNAQVIQNQRSF